MTGRILVVDDLEPNRRLLQARLEAEYYDVILANDGVEALKAAREQSPDLILLDVMMPNMDGFEACRALKADPTTRHMPVIMVTALDQQDDRVTGLEAGADEFLTKPVDDVALFARVRSLLRLKSVMDELRQRQANGLAVGAIDAAGDALRIVHGARILVIDDPGRPADRLTRRLAADHRPELITDPREAIGAATGAWDLAILNLAAQSFDGMRLAARLRSDVLTRALPILAVVDAREREVMVRALDLGVNDLLAKPVDPQELSARVRTQVKRKRYADYLRATLDQSMELAVTDQLTGLHNRRFMTGQLNDLVGAAATERGAFAVMIADIDHFKRVNDSHGHDAGDAVLREFAKRLAVSVRAVDTACRFGGEEFVVMMPGADLEAARVAAERVREAVEREKFLIPGGEAIEITVSIGVAGYEHADTADRLLKRADEALYAAKSGGRNQVVVAPSNRAAA